MESWILTKKGLVRTRYGSVVSVTWFTLDVKVHGQMVSRVLVTCSLVAVFSANLTTEYDPRPKVWRNR